MTTNTYNPPMRSNVLEKPVMRLIDRRTHLTPEEVSARVYSNLAWRGWGRVTNRWLGIVQGTGKLFPIRMFVVYPERLWVRIDLHRRDGGWGFGHILLDETMTHTIDRKYTVMEVFNQLEEYYVNGGSVPECSFQTSACYHEDRSPYDDLYGFEKRVLENFALALTGNNVACKTFWNLEAVLLDDRRNERFVNAIQANGATAGLFDALEMTIGANLIPVYIVTREVEESNAAHRRSLDGVSYDYEKAVELLCKEDMRRLTRSDIVHVLNPAIIY